MRKSTKVYIALCSILLLAFALPSQYHTSGAKAAKLDQYLPDQGSSARPIAGQMLSIHTVDMSQVPSTTFSSPATSSDHNLHKENKPTPTGFAPVDKNPHSPAANPTTPPLTTSFQGVNENFCPPAPAFCPPPDPSPDMALGVSSNWALQGVNRWFAVYSVLGALQPGWPKSFQNFFGVPFPRGCTAIPNLFNPRAFYDTNDQRFWAAALNDEVPHGKCTSTLSRMWIAVSQTNNPNGKWNVYSFDEMLGTKNFGDFTQFGFDQQAVYFSCDMWTQPSGTGTFEYENTFGVNKAEMEAGKSVTPYGFSGFESGGVQMNGIQPVEVAANKLTGPNAGLFISSFDYNFGGGECVHGCSGLVVWAIANPGTPSESLSSILVSSHSYSLPPDADQPGCTQCLGTLDPAINSTPTWRSGKISFGLVTAVNNGTHLVAGILWGQVSVSLNSSGVLTSANIYQSNYFSFTGDTSAFTPALITDANSNLYMVFTKSSSTLYPGAYYAVQPAGSPLGTFPDGGLAMMQGQASTTQSRWADYSAVSINGVGALAAWIAGEFEAANQSWATNIGKVIG